MTNAISEELGKLDVECRKDRGLAEIMQFRDVILSQLEKDKSGGNLEHVSIGRWKGKEKTRILSPWEGLSANRRSCLKCGWCEGIRYETMGAIDVTLPNSVSHGDHPS